MTVYNPQNLPKNDNINRFAYSIEVQDQLLIRKGKMIAYYGQLRFESLTSGMWDIARQAFNAPLSAQEFVVVQGKGQLILGDRANDLASYDLDAANMTVRARNLLAFTPTLRCQESTVKGYLTLVGTGKLIASSNGPVHFLDLPCRVDEQAILGWADCPSPSYVYDFGHAQGLGGALGAMAGMTLSGEEKQLDFTGQGTVLVQSSEQGLMGGSALEEVLNGLPQLTPSDLAQVASRISERLRG